MKTKSLFDHITHITQKQTKNYWDDITDADRKTWSNYMIHRFLSMKMEYVEIVNEFQRYNLKPKELYKLYTNVLPKKKEWLRYIKGKKVMKHPTWVVEIVTKSIIVLYAEGAYPPIHNARPLPLCDVSPFGSVM